MSKMRDTKYRYGFTGTLSGTQTHKWVLEGLFEILQSYKDIRKQRKRTILQHGKVIHTEMNYTT